MTISATETVRNVVVALPSATWVLEKLGIDYCCGGDKSLQDACALAGVSVETVIASLERTAQGAQDSVDTRDWQKAPLAELISYILDKHHPFTREEIVRIEQLLTKVVSVHGQNHPEVRRIQQLFRGLGQELRLHLVKEEQVLFPYLLRLEEAAHGAAEAPFAPFGTVQNPVRMMMYEHDSAGEVLRAMRQASAGYIVPADGCLSFQTLYQALQVFEEDLHQHIHLENNLLFPRAIELEDQVG